MGRAHSGSPALEDSESVCSLLAWRPQGNDSWGGLRPELAEAQNVQEQRVIQEEARAKPQRVWKYKGATVLPDQDQETAFDLMVFTQTVSSKLICMALRVKIWPVSEADDMNADAFESYQNNGK